MPVPSQRWLTRSLLAAAALVAPLRAQDPAVVGQWTPVFDMPAVALHAAVLPSGKALLFAANNGLPGVFGTLLDPATLGMTMANPPAPWLPDCSGLSFLENGNLFVTGGTESLAPVIGTDLVFTFDPFTEKWAASESMTDGRWYPTNVTMPDGRIVVMAGTSSIPLVDNLDVSIWDPAGAGSWTLLGQKLLPLYPMVHVLPGGKLFKSGPDNITETYDASTDTWQFVAKTNLVARNQGTSVLLPGSPLRVMLIGGVAPGQQPTKTCEIIDLDQPMPRWLPTAPMHFARRSHNTVILPTGDILVIGGRANTSIPWEPALESELFDPETGTWTVLASLDVPRWYHSTAVLLPDARVLAAGGTNLPSGQVYSPPYLFQGDRPVITRAPLLVKWGSPFPLEFTSTRAVNKVVLIAPSAVTHATNMSQRMLELGSFSDGGGPKSVPGPIGPTHAPAGYYMLFVVDDTGVPSVARMVRVSKEDSGFVRITGGLAGSNGIPGLDGTGTLAGGTPVTVTLSGALEHASAVLVIGFTQISAAFKGGTLVPAPHILLPGLPTGAAGMLSLTETIPAGLPAGANFTLQCWLADPGAPSGFAASNAVVGYLP